MLSTACLNFKEEFTGCLLKTNIVVNLLKEFKKKVLVSYLLILNLPKVKLQGSGLLVVMLLLSICYWLDINTFHYFVDHWMICFGYLKDTLDAVENLLKKHEAFEKSAATQEERFAALEKLTTVSLSYIPSRV